MKPSIPKGTRDFLPAQVKKRRFIFDIIEGIFKNYGYVPIETPTMENLSTLTGNYGEEGDRLVFKVLNNGDFMAKADEKALASKDSLGILDSISKRGLRYDLTVPFARYVAMHRNDITLPFKRYQIQPVWRADRPQKGRYQEFYQCDVDVVGSDSLMYEAELVSIYDEVFAKLGLKVSIAVNNRKILQGIAEVAGVVNQFAAVTVAIDKLDKIGEDGVIKELESIGIAESNIKKLISLLQIDTLQDLESAFRDSQVGLLGVEELKTFHSYFDLRTSQAEVKFDIKLARGLSYYTGCIFEVKAIGVEMGSIGGGGRYADLTSIFGMNDVPGVGISFGAERIYDVMEELKLFPDDIASDLQIFFVSFDLESHLYAFSTVSKLREQGIAADIYPSPTKIQKQMKYADARGVEWVAIIGSEEVKTDILTIKNLKTGQQEKMDIPSVIAMLNNKKK